MKAFMTFVFVMLSILLATAIILLAYVATERDALQVKVNELTYKACYMTKDSRQLFCVNQANESTPIPLYYHVEGDAWVGYGKTNWDVNPQLICQ